MEQTNKISLDGPWDFQIVSSAEEGNTSVDTWRSAVVPMPWQAQFDDLRLSDGVALYRRQFLFAPDQMDLAEDRSAILHFGAVDYQATVWVNGQRAGVHEGGYLPFEFDVIDLLQEGDNELFVRVVDASDDRGKYPDFPFSEVPHGKQSWYGPMGGIWQSVWLELRSAKHIEDLFVNPSPHDRAIALDVSLRGEPDSDFKIICTVKDPDGRQVGSTILDGTLTGEVVVELKPQLWSPDTPNLYTVTAELHIGGNPVHQVSKTCGFRTVEARNGRIYLNGEPIYLRGVLDQAYYPETIYTPNSLELLEDQARKIKELGFNCLRTHIKIEDPLYYDVADRLGLLVWTEIPNWILLTEEASRRAKETFQGMVKRDGHHPSIFAWTLVNENWGTDLTRNAEHRRWLADFFQEAKEIDPTRLIVDNSACCDNAHVASDLEDFHHYRAIPDHASDWDAWVADFSGRSDWSWYSDYENKRRSDLPLLVSEFGNWGLPDPQEIQEGGSEPWWFETGIQWEDKSIVYPHGVLQRFESCGLSDLFSSYAEFARQSQEHMARSLHYEISTMRLHKSIAGYVVTEFTDVHWECNGLLTMQREIKHGLDPLLKDLNQDRVVVLRPQQWSGRPGQSLEVHLLAVGVAGAEQVGSVYWTAGSQSGQLSAPGGSVFVQLEEPGVITINARWVADDGSLLAQNQVDLYCVAPVQTSDQLHVVGDPKLAEVLRDLNYDVNEGQSVGDLKGDKIVVADRYTRNLEQHVQQGGRVLLLAGEMNIDDDLAVSLPVGQIVKRAGTLWQGDWANSFSWIKQEGPLGHLPGGPLLEMPWSQIMPNAVIARIPGWVALRDHSWAGLALGWIHNAVSLLTVLPYGRGRIVITTFRLNADSLASDAVGQALFSGILNLL